jgi:flagellar basal body-associated protein FliL
MADTKKEGKGAAEKPAPWKGRLILIVPVVALLAAGVWFWRSRGDDAAAQATEGTHVKSTLHLETFVLNLADTEQRSYLRVGVDLGLSHEPKKGEEGPPVAQMRDIILGVLAEAKVADLLTANGKTKLKEDLLRALQSHLPGLGVEEVYYTEFLIQR